MPITRTAMIDDDGSGTTGTILNNAWKQELYAQIDGLITYGTWTPVDASGAALVFQSGTTGKYAKYGRVVFIWMQVVYPATANTSQAKIGGLPAVVRSATGGTQGYGQQWLWWLPEATSEVVPLTTTSAPISNTNVSGANLIVSAVYLTD